MRELKRRKVYERTVENHKNCVAGEYLYAVYRLMDVNETDHLGNREFATGYLKDKVAF